MERFAGKEDLLTATYLDHHDDYLDDGVSHRFGLFSDHDERLNAEQSSCAGLLSEPLGDPPALEPSSTRKVQRPLLHFHHHSCITTTSPPQLHLGKGSVTPGTGVSLRRPTTLIQRALKSDPVSLSCANLYKGRGTFSKLCLQVDCKSKELVFLA